MTNQIEKIHSFGKSSDGISEIVYLGTNLNGNVGFEGSTRALCSNQKELVIRKKNLIYQQRAIINPLSKRKILV